MTALLMKLFLKNKNDRSKAVNLGAAAGIVCNLILFLTKLSVGILSFSSSVVADAFNNLSDMGSSIVTFVGFKLSNKPADKEHPFGHGRMEYMSGLIISFIIMLVGFELLKSSAEKIIHPVTLNISIITLIVLIFSILLKFWMFLFNRKLGKTINSNALIATAFDSLSDVVSTSAVLLSVIINVVFSLNIDGFISAAVSLFIIYSGIKSFKETINPLLGMPPEPKMVETIKDIVMSYDDFKGIHDLVVHNYGPGRTFATLHVEVPDNIDIIKCHEEIDECEKELSIALSSHIVIHMDPIATNDKRVNEIKFEVEEKIKEFNEECSIHDFRIVEGDRRINVIFDISVPFSIKLTETEIKKAVSALVKEVNPLYNAVITVDRNYC